MNASIAETAIRVRAQAPGHEDADPLRLCFVSADYPNVAAGGLGGIGAHTSALAHAIADLGHDVSVLTESAGRAQRFLDGSVSVHAVPRSSLRMWKLGRWVPVSWLRRSFTAWRVLRRLHRDQPFDLVSFPDGYGEGFRYSFSPVAPFAVQLFGPASFVQQWDKRVVPPVRARFERWMERRPAMHASLVIAATRRFADLVGHEWALDPQRIRIIRNPLNLARFRPAGMSASRREHRVLFAGHLQRLKGLEALAESIPLVAARHPDVEVQLVGNDTSSAAGGGSMRRFLERTLAQQGMLDRARFFDPVPQEELVPFYQACTVFVLPSLNDVYPNAVLEAMACGRPCVVTDTVGTAELVTEADAGRVVPPNDPQALAAAIAEILAMPAPQRDEMGARGRRIVERVCATSIIAAQTVAAYREVIRERAARRQPGRGVSR
jgi:glycosyltransferase involved in cell wall biosynthesis